MGLTYLFLLFSIFPLRFFTFQPILPFLDVRQNLLPVFTFSNTRIHFVKREPSEQPLEYMADFLFKVVFVIV